MTRIDYAAANKQYRKQRTALTRARNSGDPLKVLTTVEKALADFEQGLWPDAWAMWHNALDDAYLSWLLNGEKSETQAEYEACRTLDTRFNAALRRFR